MINNINPSPTFQKNITKINKTTSLTPQKGDSVELTTSQKKKSLLKTIGVVAGSALALGSTFLIYAIGRNPVKMAKVLKGGNLMDEAFQIASRELDDIISKNSDEYQDILKRLGKDEPTQFKKALDDILNLKNKENIFSDEIQETIVKLKNNYAAFEKKYRLACQNGENVSDFAKQFLSENREDIESVEKYLNSIKTWDLSSKNINYDDFVSIRRNFVSSSFEYQIKPKEIIESCPKEKLPKDMIFYHGTKKPKGIYKSGFSPFTGRQNVIGTARELGAGIYLTPDVSVATGFSGLTGDIIPTKVHADKIALVTDKMFSELNQEINNFILKNYTKEGFEKLTKQEQSTIIETLTRKIFKDLGFEGVYTAKGMKTFSFANILTPDINKILGTDQSQVTIFDSENVEIVSRTFKERVKDLSRKFKSVKAQCAWAKEHPLGF